MSVRVLDQHRLSALNDFLHLLRVSPFQDASFALLPDKCYIVHRCRYAQVHAQEVLAGILKTVGDQNGQVEGAKSQFHLLFRYKWGT